MSNYREFSSEVGRDEEMVVGAFVARLAQFHMMICIRRSDLRYVEQVLTILS